MPALTIVRRPLLATQVADQVRDAIVYGSLKLGEAISEERLATQLGVSRTPVREALSTLQMQGLVEILPQRGSFVFEPKRADIEELCDYRVIIEVNAMRLAYSRSAQATLNQLQAAETAQGLAETAGDRIAAARADEGFHNAFISQCGNSLLDQAYRLVSGRIGAIRFSARGSAASRAQSNRDHRAIIRAFARGDLAAAERVLTAHIMRMKTHFAAAQRSSATD